MTAIRSFVQEVEEAVGGGDADKRALLLRRVVNLFTEQAPMLGGAQVSVFDEVICRLSRDIEFKARVALSEQIADIAKAPQRIVRELAFDPAIEVARAVLERSEQVEADDLVELARERGQDFLLALSHRRVLSERITDIIVDRGNEQVVRTVAGNDGARFSTFGFDTLVDRAQHDAALQHILRARRDIPQEHMAKLVAIATEMARETLAKDFGGAAPDVVDETLKEIAATLSQRDGGGALVDDFAAATRVVDEKIDAGGVAEDDIVAWIGDGRLEDALAAMARLAKVSPQMVASAYYAPHYDPLLYLVRALRFSWKTFKVLLTSKSDREPPTEVFQSAFANFQELSVPTAQRILRFLAARESAERQNASAA